MIPDLLKDEIKKSSPLTLNGEDKMITCDLIIYLFSQTRKNAHTA